MDLLSMLVDRDSYLKKFLEDEGQHPAEAIELGHSHDLAADVRRLHVRCHDCARTWDLVIPHEALRYGGGQELIMRKVQDFFLKIARTLCFKFSLAAELAEWLTQRVAAGGAEGVKYSSLLQEAVDEHFCDTRDVDAMIVRLGFRMEFRHLRGFDTARIDGPEMMMDVAYVGGVYIHDGTVHLPYDHPLHYKRRKGNA